MFEVKRDQITGLYSQVEIIDPPEVESEPVKEVVVEKPLVPQRPPLIPKKIKR